MIAMRKKEDIVGGLAGWSEAVEVLCDIRDALVKHNEREKEDLRWRKERSDEQRMMQEALLRDTHQVTVTQAAVARTMGAEPPSPSDIESMIGDIPGDESPHWDGCSCQECVDRDEQGEEEETEGPAGD